MNISEKRFNSILNLFLIAIPSIIFFRKPCSWLIFIFSFFCLLFYRKMEFPKKSLKIILIITLPLLLEILFFWNNDSLKLGLKSMEKSTSLLLFSIFIIGNFKRIDLIKILKGYTVLTTILVLFFFFRFIIFFPQYINKYLAGIHLWEMGYVFTNSFGVHAPALNMHLSFVCVVSFFIMINSFKEKKSKLLKIGNIILLICSFFLVLFVNTRMALFQTIIGFIIVFFYEVFRKYSLVKVLKLAFVSLIIMFISLYLFVKKDSYMIEKYTTTTFAHMDKVGKLDELDHPEIVAFNSLVTRVSIWKSAWELSLENLPFGAGSSDSKPELVKYFKLTNQKFLAKYEFPTHNQYLDFLLKFGILGIFAIFVYIFTIGYIGVRIKNSIILFFFFLFFTSNLTDDFLIRFDGIAFSGFWLSIFGAFYFQFIYSDKLMLNL